MFTLRARVRAAMLAVVPLAVFVLAAQATAAGFEDIVWDGGGADTSWFTPENWSGDAVPQFNETAIFNGTSAKDCDIAGATELQAIRVESGYLGALRFSDANVRLNAFGVAFEQSGGTVDFGTSPPTEVSTFFRLNGDVIFSGGTTLPSTATFWFEGAGSSPTLFSAPAAGVTVGTISSVESVVHVSGAVTLTRSLSVGQSGIIPIPPRDGHLVIEGEVRMATGASFSSVNSGCTLDAAPGGLLDAIEAHHFNNFGTLLGSGGVIRRPAAGLSFTDDEGNQVTAASPGDPLWVTLLDDDANFSGSAVDIVSVTVRSHTTGDEVQLTLQETASSSSAVFRGDNPLPTEAGAANPGDRILQFDGSEVVTVRYEDPDDPLDVLEVSLVRAPVVWAGREASSWHVDANWRNEARPRAYDHVLFDDTSSADCTTSQPVAVENLHLSADYRGTLLMDEDMTIEGDFTQEGGTIDFGSGFHSRLVSGNLVRTGGTMLASEVSLYVGGDRDTVADFGVGPVVLKELVAFSGVETTLAVHGDVAVRQTAILGTTAGTDVFGTVTLLAGGGLDVLPLGNRVLRVQPGGVIDAREGGYIGNLGTIQQVGTGVVLWNSSAFGLLIPDDSIISSGVVGLSTPFLVHLLDSDENEIGTMTETIEVTVRNLTGGDEETLTLTEIPASETIPHLGRFALSTPLTLSVGAGVVGDGRLQGEGTSTVELRYEDPEDAGDVNVVTLTVHFGSSAGVVVR